MDEGKGKSNPEIMNRRNYPVQHLLNLIFAGMHHVIPTGFHQVFEGLIWKIKIDSGSQVLAIETRNPESRLAFFSAIHYPTGKLLFRDKTVEGSWLYTLDAVHGNEIYLHGFSGENIPERKGILALNAITGDTTWQSHHLTLETVTADGLVVYDPLIRPKRLKLIDFLTRKVMDENPAQYSPVEQDLRYPTLYGDASVFKEISAFRPVGPVWMIRHKGFTCLAYHTESGKLFSQHLLILVENEVVLEEYLSENIQKLNPEAFFISQDRVFCIRNKNEIVSYLL